MKEKISKDKITSSEMAVVVLDMIKKMSNSLHDDLKFKIEEKGIKFNKKRENIFAEEIIIINFWIVSKVLSSDKKVLDELHKKYLYGRSVLAQTKTNREVNKFVKKEEEKLNKRYKEYYKHFDNKAEFVLALAMLKNMIDPKSSEEKKLTDIRLMSCIISYLFEMMKFVLNVRKTIEITDI